MGSLWASRKWSCGFGFSVLTTVAFDPLHCLCTSVHIDPSLALAEDADLTEEVSSPAFAFAGNMRSPSSLPRANDCNMAGERGCTVHAFRALATLPRPHRRHRSYDLWLQHSVPTHM